MEYMGKKQKLSLFQRKCILVYFLLWQTRQPVFVRLLQGAFRVSQCDWLSGQQKYHVENCIKTLTDIGKYFLFFFEEQVARHTRPEGHFREWATTIFFHRPMPPTPRAETGLPLLQSLWMQAWVSSIRSNINIH